MTFQSSNASLYMAEEDLYRLGNFTSSRLDHVRSGKDVTTYDRNGVIYVRANGKGISLLTEKRANTFTGSWLWKIPAGTRLPNGLVLNHDAPEHYALCPKTDMSVEAYRALLLEVAVLCVRTRKA